MRCCERSIGGGRALAVQDAPALPLGEIVRRIDDQVAVAADGLRHPQRHHLAVEPREGARDVVSGEVRRTAIVEGEPVRARLVIRQYRRAEAARARMDEEREARFRGARL